MRETIELWAQTIPDPLAVMVLAALPIFELRLAIPFARTVLDMAPIPSFGWGVIGNFLPVPFILWWLGPFTAWAEHHWGWIHRFLERLFASTRRRHTGRFERLRDAALILFVAIPLPITGAWSGALAAFVFGVRRPKAMALIGVGILIAGIVVSLLTQGASELLS